MKIIGQSDKKFILECDRDEVANLIGYYYAGADGCPTLKPGTEIAVHDMYTQLSNMKRMEGSYKQVASTLEFMRNTLELVNPILNGGNDNGQTNQTPERT